MTGSASTVAYARVHLRITAYLPSDIAGHRREQRTEYESLVRPWALSRAAEALDSKPLYYMLQGGRHCSE